MMHTVLMQWTCIFKNSLPRQYNKAAPWPGTLDGDFKLNLMVTDDFPLNSQSRETMDYVETRIFVSAWNKIINRKGMMTWIRNIPRRCHWKYRQVLRRLL